MYAGGILGTERYEIVRKLGTGGMGVVYEARDRLRGGNVALKTVLRLDPEARRRFKNEFRSLADISHPNLVSLYELVATEEPWFFTMELLDGSDIAQHFASTERWDVPGAEEALRHSLRQLAEGVAALHRTGHLHHDIKPTNVIVARGRTVLLDFGVIAGVDSDVRRDVGGTPKYMSPEQLTGESLSFASDWYAVGTLIYELLVGVTPYRGKFLELLRAKIVDDPVPPSTLREGIPAELETLCLELLRVEPDERPNAAEVLARLGRASRSSLSILAPVRADLVGREEELTQLSDALASVEKGQGGIVIVRGESGMGKSALIDAFLTDSCDGAGALILDARCYERELVRYKAVDGLVDALAEHLADLDASELHTILPPNAELLATAFPVLGHVPGIGPAAPSSVSDPRTLRDRAFAALRELLARLARSRTLVMHIDDVQWGDGESAELIGALMDPPNTPPLLLVLGYRSEEEDRSQFVRALLAREVGLPPQARSRRVEVAGLSVPDGVQLATALLQQRNLSDPDVARTIAEESGGSPLFINAMARHVDKTRGALESGLTLDGVLGARTSRLPEAARLVLDLVAVAGSPSAHAVIQAAGQLSARDYDDAVQQLRTEQMVRSLGTDEGDSVAVYHDRIGEIVVAHLDPDARRLQHRRLAGALAADGEADAETLFVHYRGAGLDARAAHYAMLAAERAAGVLSFERAAALYRVALELGPPEDRDPAEISERLADALVSAGRGMEAADAFLEAAERRSGAARLELRRRAGEEQLRAGYLARGQETLRAVMSEIGLRMPSNAVEAIAGLLYWRLRLRLRGLDFVFRAPGERDARAALRVDTLYGASSGLSMSDPASAGLLGTQTVIEAYRLGDPERLARALMIEIAFVATEGTRSAAKVEELWAGARPVIRQAEGPRIEAVERAIAGIVAFQQGRFTEAHERCEVAREIMLTECTGMGWEVGTMTLFLASAQTFLGTMSGLATARTRAAEAAARGDLYTSASIRAAAVPALLLSHDDPAGSRAEAAEALRLWGEADRFQNLHFMSTMSHVQADLYEEKGESALSWIERNERGMRWSMLLSVQVIRSYWTYARANARLAVAVAGRHDRRKLIRAAAKDGAALVREGVPWAIGLGNLVLANVHTARGDRVGAAEHAGVAADLLEQVDMTFYAQAAHYVRGWALGGARGLAIRERIKREARDAGVVVPRRIVLMFAPALTLAACD